MTAVGSEHWAASSATYLELGSTATATGGGKASNQVLKGIQFNNLAKPFVPTWTVGRKVGPQGNNLDQILVTYYRFQNIKSLAEHFTLCKRENTMMSR